MWPVKRTAAWAVERGEEKEMCAKETRKEGQERGTRERDKRGKRA